MPIAVEQQNRAELLRQQLREREAREAEEENDEFADGNTGNKDRKSDRFPISSLKAGLGFIPAVMLDSLEALCELLAGISVIGLPIAAACAVVSAIFSGILFLAIGIWLLFEGVSPFTPRGIRIFLILGATAFGNAVISWLPAWSGFFFYLFIMSYKQKLIPHVAKNK